MHLQRSQNRKLSHQWLVCSLLTMGILAGSPLTARAQTSEADTGEFLRIEQPLGLRAGVAVAGVGLIGLELWWFLLSKTKAQTAQTTDGIQSIDVTVDGGYSPNQIGVRAGQLVRLNFLRKDPSSCLEQVILPDFNKAVDLPLDQLVTVEFVPEKAGDYTFHCGMNMFRGTITVKPNVE